MARKPTISYNTKGGLEEILFLVHAIRDDLDVGIERAAANEDGLMVQIYGRLYRRINAIDRKARLALVGEREPEEKTIKEKTDAILKEMENARK